MRERLEPNEVAKIRLHSPIKPKITYDNKKEVNFTCPNCGYNRYYKKTRIHYPNNCEDCGQKFNWIEQKKANRNG